MTLGIGTEKGEGGNGKPSRETIEQLAVETYTSLYAKDTTRKEGLLYLPEHIITMVEQRLGGAELLSQIREIKLYNGFLPGEIESWSNGFTHERVLTPGDDVIYKNDTALAIVQFAGPRRREEYRTMLQAYANALKETTSREITFKDEDKDNDPLATARSYKQYTETLTEKIIAVIRKGKQTKHLPTIMFNAGDNLEEYPAVKQKETDNHQQIQLLTYKGRSIIHCNGLAGDLISNVLNNLLAEYNARAEQQKNSEAEDVKIYIAVPGAGVDPKMKLHDTFIPRSSKEQHELRNVGLAEVINVHNSINDLEARAATELEVYCGTTVDAIDPYTLEIPQLRLPSFSSSFLDTVTRDAVETIARARRSYSAITPRLGIVGYVTSTPLQADFNGRQTTDLKGRENTAEIILAAMNNYQK